MAATDILFLFLFLPLSLLIYHISREEYREIVLLAVSLIFYACGSCSTFLILCISVGVNLLIGWFMDISRDRKRLKAGLLALGVICNLFVLGYYKYVDAILRLMGSRLGFETVLEKQGMPLGLSFFTFKAISYLADIYLGTITIRKNPIRSALYLSFFAQVQSGPLSRYNSMETDKRFLTFDGFSEGVCRFLMGVNKKVLIANILSNVTTEIFGANVNDVSTAYAWLGAVCYSLELYFDFSGYSDMAIGLGEMFGYGCPENFNYPYMTGSVSEFWRRWHITLGAWFRDYVYIPLGGSRVKRGRLYVNLLIVWILTGIWHGARWNFIFWGLGYFLFISFEKTTEYPSKFNSKGAKACYRILSLLFINFQWVMFRADGLKAGMQYIGTMVRFTSQAVADKRALFLLKDNFVFIAAAILLCFPIVPWIEKKTGQRKAIGIVCGCAAAVLNGFLFIWAVSFIVAGRNNPFAYANF